MDAEVKVQMLCKLCYKKPAALAQLREKLAAGDDVAMTFTNICSTKIK